MRGRPVYQGRSWKVNGKGLGLKIQAKLYFRLLPLWNYVSVQLFKIKYAVKPDIFNLLIYLKATTDISILSNMLLFVFTTT